MADHGRWEILARKVQAARIVEAFRLFRANHIEPILIKGLAAARYYPESFVRSSIDIDLAVSKHDFKASRSLVMSVDAHGLAIDLHNELRHLDTVAWDSLFANSELIDIDGHGIRVLRPEDHLRVLCVHWLLDGAHNKNRLWDVYYLLHNRPAGFDWHRFLGLVSERRRRWLVCTVGLAQKYLGLDLTGTPLENACHDIPEWLIRSVENLWADETKELPLENAIFDGKKLYKQALMRFRPNPIRATIEMEGSFDAKMRIHYQIGNFFQRVVPSLRRIWSTLRSAPPA